MSEVGKKSNLPMNQLAEKYSVSEHTVRKWKQREEACDRSSRPHTIYYSLSALEQEIIKSVRRSAWLSLDEIEEIA